jgi:DNA gyrase subunit A
MSDVLPPDGTPPGGSPPDETEVASGSAGAPPPTDKLAPINIEDEMRASYLDYAMSVIIGRALPDVRDGLKPVHRRVLFAMQDLGNGWNRPYKKSARVVGDVIGKYHPHGDAAVYDTLVRMAQEFSLRHLLVDGQGNFGSVDGDPPAAMRYTEVRMAKLASEMLADIEKETVDFGPNYDGSLSEPLVLPTRFPNLLINGSSGIAVGMATNIPPHNLEEVIDATVALARDSSLDVPALMKFVPGPDFPTGGLVYGTSALRTAYETGRGVIQVRGRAAVEEGKKHDRIIVTEIPYFVNKTTLIEKIAEMVKDDKLEGVSDIRDESSREGMRIVIELKRDAAGDVILNQLYANTQLETSFGCNMVAIVDGQPRTLSLKELLQHFIDHRREVVTRRSRFELREARKRFNVVFGLLAAIDAIDRIIEIIRRSPDTDTARATLMAEKLPMSPAFKELCQRLVTFEYATGTEALTTGHVRLNQEQAQAILDMRLARLTGLERDKLAAEASELHDTIERLVAILADDGKLMVVIIEELLAVKAEYAEPRRTELVADVQRMSREDLIPEEEMVVTLSHLGYIKRAPVDTYRAQKRGGRGKTAATTREEDFVESVMVASTHSYLLIFTEGGKIYWLKVHEIPEAERQARGKPLLNLIKIEKDERIAAVVAVRQFVEGRHVMFVTANGTVKKTDLMAYSNPRPSGLIGTAIDEGDRLIKVAVTDGNCEILLATRQGQAIRFVESDVRSMGRNAYGVRGVTLKKDGDAVVGMVVVSKAEGQRVPEVLTICDGGYGKRTDLEEYRLQARGGSGVLNFKLTDKTGSVAAVSAVTPTDEVMVVTNRGMMIRVKVEEISSQSRATQGVRVITVEEGESVVSVAPIVEGDDVAEAPAAP